MKLFWREPLKPPFLVAQGFAKLMVARDVKGSIINIGSGAARNMRATTVHYCTSKTALDRLTKGLSIELASLGIRVNCVEPGFAAGSVVSPLSDEHVKRVTGHIPLGRASGPMDKKLIRSPAYQWPGQNRCAVVFSADVDVESPFIWNNRGQEVTTLGELEQRRFGPRRGLLRLVDLLAEFHARGSFYVPGVVMERYPWITPGLLEEGHEVGLHGYYHEQMQTLDDSQFAQVMERSLGQFRSQGGGEQVGFRSPSWELGPHQVALLKSSGVLYDSSLMGWDHPYNMDGLTEVPAQWAIDDAIYFRYFGGGRDTGPPANPVQVLESWLMEFDAVVETGGLFMITVHPWMSGRAQRVEMLRRLFSHIASTHNVWWTTAAEVAQWHKASINSDRFEVSIDRVDTHFQLS